MKCCNRCCFASSCLCLLLMAVLLHFQLNKSPVYTKYLSTTEKKTVCSNQFSSTKNTSWNHVIKKPCVKQPCLSIISNKFNCLTVFFSFWLGRSVWMRWIFIQLSLLMEFTIVCYRLNVCVCVVHCDDGIQYIEREKKWKFPSINVCFSILSFAKCSMCLSLLLFLFCVWLTLFLFPFFLPIFLSLCTVMSFFLYVLWCVYDFRVWYCLFFSNPSTFTQTHSFHRWIRSPNQIYRAEQRHTLSFLSIKSIRKHFISTLFGWLDLSQGKPNRQHDIPDLSVKVNTVFFFFYWLW